MSVVFTSGVYDLFHWSHVDFLRRARALGDRLVVGLDTDASVVLCKGRPPVCKFAERREVVIACRYVELVIGFAGASGLHRLLRYVRPDVVVKGGMEYDDCAESKIVKEWRGEFVVLPIPSNSIHTSDLIERIRRAIIAVP